MDDGLKGKRSLVLCGTRGIGLGVARCLARDGSAVTISGRDERRAAEVAAELPGAGHGSFACDFGDPGQVGRLAATTGPYDVVLLNSPGFAPGRVGELTPARLEEAMRLMLLPFQHVVEAVLPAMKRAGWGRLVAITSSSVEVPISGLAGSSVARAAVSSYLRLLAQDVAPHGITVNQVLPGKIETDRVRAVEEATARRRGTAVDRVREETLRAIPLGRYGTPEDVGELVAFLASDRAAYLTGTGIRCDGGYLTPA
ncbi:SDR family oxidoreductase [Lentzea sp. NPDC004789]